MTVVARLNFFAGVNVVAKLTFTRLDRRVRLPDYFSDNSTLYVFSQNKVEHEFPVVVTAASDSGEFEVEHQKDSRLYFEAKIDWELERPCGNLKCPLIDDVSGKKTERFQISVQLNTG